MKLNNALCVLLFFAFMTLHSQEWTQNFKITEPTRVAENSFGFSVSTYDGYVAYGAHQAHVGALENAGRVYIAKADCEGWTIYQELTLPDAVNNCSFGFNLTLYEKTLMVSGCNPEVWGDGTIYIYERDDDDQYVFKQKISHPENFINHNFSLTFAISGNFMVAGAVNKSIGISPSNELYPFTQGAAYIYFKDNTGNWSLVQKIIASDGAPQHHFGTSVDIFENTIVVGANREGDDRAGAAYIFERNTNTNIWNEVQKVVAFDYRGTLTSFGFNVKIDEDIIAVSAGQDSNYNYPNTVPGVANGTGAIYVYKKNTTGNWFGYQKLTASDSMAEALNFGTGLEIYQDQIAVAGAAIMSEANGSLNVVNGRIYMFNKDADDNWTEYQIITPYRTIGPYGSKISLYEEDMFVNAFWDFYDSNEENSLPYAGSVYLYNTYEFEQSEKPVLKEIPVLTACADLGEGLSSNFDMSSIEDDLVENSELFVFAYTDELGNDLPSPLPDNYSNSIPYSETIYVRIENRDNPNCFEKTEIELETSPAFELNEISDLYECDELGTGYAFFDLSNLAFALVEDSSLYEFSYRNDQSIDITQNINEPYQNSSEYFEEITIKVTDRNTLCTREKTISLNVIVTKANDIGTFQECEAISPDMVIFDTSSLERQLLQGQTNKLIYYYDDDGSLLETPLPNPFYVESNSIKSIRARVEDAISGCYDETIITFDSTNCSEDNNLSSLNIPKFFTPNGDGTNDTWKILISSIDIPQDYLIYIFDRYGKLIKTLDENSGWDGIYNGILMPSDDYWYRIILENESVITGHFSLKR